MGETKADTVPLFGKFKKAWGTIDQTRFVPGTTDPDVAAAIKPINRTQIKEFIEENKIFRYFPIKFFLQYLVG